MMNTQTNERKRLGEEKGRKYKDEGEETGNQSSEKVAMYGQKDMMTIRSVDQK